MEKIFKIVASWGNLGNSGGDGGRDGVLNSNHRGTGRGKMAGDLGERVPRGIPKPTFFHSLAQIFVTSKKKTEINLVLLLFVV